MKKLDESKPVVLGEIDANLILLRGGGGLALNRRASGGCFIGRLLRQHDWDDVRMIRTIVAERRAG